MRWMKYFGNSIFASDGRYVLHVDYFSDDYWNFSIMDLVKKVFVNTHTTFIWGGSKEEMKKICLEQYKILKSMKSLIILIITTIYFIGCVPSQTVKVRSMSVNNSVDEWVWEGIYVAPKKYDTITKIVFVHDTIKIHDTVFIQLKPLNHIA